LPAELCTATSGELVIGHASGTITVDAARDPDSGAVRHATILRTARRLFQGEVLYRTGETA
jgi:2-methylaconitate cis-trans-isomerase PrpF